MLNTYVSKPAYSLEWENEGGIKLRKRVHKVTVNIRLERIDIKPG